MSHFERQAESEEHSLRTGPIANGTLLIFFAGALLLRIVRSELTPILSVDGTTFIRLAELWLDGRPAQALAHDFHPLYGALIAVGGWLGLELETAGRWVAHLSSASLVFPIGWLGACLGGRRVGSVAAAFVACDPYLMRFGADVLSDSLCVAAWMFALAVGLPATNPARLRRHAMAGFLAGLAYLTRPEGGEAVVVLSVVLVGTILLSQPGRRRRPFVALLALLGGFAVCALPYLGWLSLERETLTLSQKKSVVDLATGAASGGLESQSVLEHLFSTLFPTYALFAILGFAQACRNRGPLWWATLLSIALHLLLLVGLTQTHGYVSRRHLAPVLAWAAPWAAVGLLWTWERARWPRRGSLRLASLLTLALLPALIKNARPTRTDKIELRELGQRIEQRHGSGRTLATTRPRVAYYARARWVSIDPATERPRFDADLAVLTQEERERGWDVLARQQGFEEVGELGQDGSGLSLWIRR